MSLRHKHWRPIGTAPRDGTPFLATQTVASGYRSGGVLLRAAMDYPAHQFEQFVSGKWHPTFINPKFWCDALPLHRR